jgi:hypothetical protein
MLTVAAAQVRLVDTVQLSPWKGGGFGMFASTDGGSNRRVRVYLVDQGAEHSVTPRSPSLRKLAERAGVLPTRARLEKLARAVGEQARLEHHALDRVRVEVWRTHFAKATLMSEQVLLAEAAVDLDAHVE